MDRDNETSATKWLLPAAALLLFLTVNGQRLTPREDFQARQLSGKHQEPLKNLTTLHIYGYGPYLVNNSYDLMRFYDPERTSCMEDSGGGVVEFGPKGIPTIQAVVTSGDLQCDPKKFVQVNTMVHPYIDLSHNGEMQV